MSKVILHRHAALYLKRLPKDQKQRVKSILTQLEQSPLYHPNIKQMAGEWVGYHRLRSGNLRIIFWFDVEEDIVYVDHIGPRGDIYK